ncbi:MAG: c-type cytochrome biogenesis protein CcsB [Candidatus Omnitrophica bacterium]|nr:c-type cytochrome biogenesis protein CcsB [Candidatus Omnitrophota bacterium]
MIFFLSSRSIFSRVGWWATGIGFLIHTTALVVYAISKDYFPVTNLYESFIFFAWLLVVSHLIVCLRLRDGIAGIFLMPLVVSLMVFSQAVRKTSLVSLPTLQGGWLIVHVVSCFIAYTAFTLAFGFALMYLWQERELKTKKIDVFFFRLPAIELLDTLEFIAIIFGFIFLTVGVISGSVWAQFVWARFWQWDPKETWALILWVIYLFYLFGRAIWGWRGRRCAYFAVIGFLVMIFTFFGTNFLFQSTHNYLK